MSMKVEFGLGSSAKLVLWPTLQRRNLQKCCQTAQRAPPGEDLKHPSCQVARALGPGHTVVTVLCDGGHRHLSRFHSPEYLASVGLMPQHCAHDLSFVT